MKFSKTYQIFAITLLLTLTINLTQANEAEIIIVGEIGSFSGAFLKIISPTTEEASEKIYPSEYLTKAGVIKFQIETSLPEATLNIMMIQNGEIIKNLEKGPFSINGSKILIDEREIIAQPAQETPKEETPTKKNETPRKTPTATIENNETILEVENNTHEIKEKIGQVLLTGKAIFLDENNSINLGPSISGSIFILILFASLLLTKHKKRKKITLDKEDKELKYTKEKVIETEKRIQKIKEDREKRRKIKEEKERLQKDKKNLEELEELEEKESETIENAN